MKEIYLYKYAKILFKTCYETDEKDKLYHYIIAAPIPQGKGQRPINQLTDIYSKKDIEVGDTVPVFYDFFNRKYKIELKEYENKKWKEIWENGEPAPEIDGQQNLFEEEKPF